METDPLLEAVNKSLDTRWLKTCAEFNTVCNPPIAEAARKRLVEVEVALAVKLRLGGDTVDTRVAESVRAYREFLKLKHGRNQAAGYTERDLRNLGAKMTVIKTVATGKVTEGLRALQVCGRLDCSYEQIAIDFAAIMPEDVVSQAHRTLRDLKVLTKEFTPSA